MVPFRSMLVLSLFISLGINAIGQENNATSYQLHGFVRSDFYEDSRKMSTSSLDFFSYYPMPRRLNAYGDDLNDVPSAGLSSVFTRFQLSMDGPGIFGASSSQSYVEADFGGSPSYWLVRIRQAYTRLNWKKGYLLVGQYWHPLFTPDLKPDVLSLNTGSPFQPFNRSPQLLLNYGDRLKWTAAAVYQMMYTSTGPDGKTYLYQHNAVVPDLFASVDYSEHRFLTGLAVDYKSILPEQYITDGNGVKTVNKRKLNTPAFMVYGKYTGKSLIVSAKALYGQNLTDHNLIGGYAITPDHNYIPYNTFTSFINLTYGVKHQFDLFAGYSANLGPDKTLPENSNFYGFGVDEANTSEEKMIGTMYRLTPSYSYNLPHWKIGVELEYTNAAWGKRAAEGSIIDLDRSDNQRVYAKLMYKF